SKGVIGDLFVTNGDRLPEPREVEGRLLAHVIETLQQSPGIHRVEAQLLVHDAGVLARPFLDQGFRRQPRLFMAMPLSRPTRPAPSIYPDFEIRGWLDSDYQSAAAVITAAYRGHVDADFSDSCLSFSGSLCFLTHIVPFPACGLFDPEASFVVSHKITPHMVGLILCSRVRHDVGHVTQVCILPEYRSRGVGEAL